jgi:hypothetical protein
VFQFRFIFIQIFKLIIFPILSKMDPLMLAIQSTSPKALRDVMGRMCRSSAEIRRVAEYFLLVDPSSGPESEGKKRKLGELSENERVLVPKYDTCAHCEEEFEVAVNEGELCSWHAGKVP